jgi:hypothetical protein
VAITGSTGQAGRPARLRSLGFSRCGDQLLGLCAPLQGIDDPALPNELRVRIAAASNTAVWPAVLVGKGEEVPGLPIEVTYDLAPRASGLARLP